MHQRQMTTAIGQTATDQTTITKLAADWLAAHREAEAHRERYHAASEMAERVTPPEPFRGVNPGTPQEAAMRELWLRAALAIEDAYDVHRLGDLAQQAGRRAAAIAWTAISVRPRTIGEAARKLAMIIERTRNGEGGLDDVEPLLAFLGDLELLATGEPSLDSR